MEKLRVNYLKTILYINIATAVIFLILYFTICKISWQPTASPLIICIYAILSIFFSVIVPKTFSLSYDDKFFYVVKFGKEEVYEFKHVLYIDEPYTEKHKALTFYLDTGKLKFLSFDKDKKIYDVFKTHCKNTISRESFIARFPQIRL